MDVARENSRLLAIRLLHRADHEGVLPTRLIETETRQRAFVQEMVFGVTRNQAALTWCARRFCKRMPTPNLLAAIHVGLYQLLFLDDVEPYAAVNETVEATKELFAPAQGDFVNAVLRRALREKEACLKALQKQPPSVRCSHPAPLIKRWQNRYGKAATESLCHWNNQRPALHLRVRPPFSRDRLAEHFKEAGIPIELHKHPDFLTLAGHGVRVENAPGFNEGAFVIQDPATLGAVDLLQPQPGERIWDACAAPGGKTIAIADRMNGKGALLASDLNKKRLPALKENLARCQLKWVRTDRIDAAQPDDDPGDRFDAILLDVPCSNTGVIQRRPEARFRITHEHLAPLQTLQATLIDQALARLKPDGRLVYSTCSLEPEENEEQIAAALERHPGLQCTKEHRSFPPDDHMDGAYAARLEWHR